MDIDEKNKVLFINLIGMFHTLAWQQLGKIANPVTGKVEKSLEGARSMIDTLEMLKVKTSGQRGEEETRFLEDSLKDLRLNFIDEAGRAKKEENESSSVETEKDAGEVEE